MAENKSGRKGELFNEKLITPLVLIFVPIGSFEFFDRSNYLLRWTKLIESQKKNEKKQKRNDFLFFSFQASFEWRLYKQMPIWRNNSLLETLLMMMIKKYTTNEEIKARNSIFFFLEFGW